MSVSEILDFDVSMSVVVVGRKLTVNGLFDKGRFSKGTHSQKACFSYGFSKGQKFVHFCTTLIKFKQLQTQLYLFINI